MNPKNIAQVSELFDTERSAVGQLEERLGISKASINRYHYSTIGHVQDGFAFGPKLPTKEQMGKRVDACRQPLRMWNSEKGFLDRLVIGDKTWLHFYESETGIQNMH